ncbi:MAG: zinc ribbon domain-containing protein [Candidatus Limivivens sp.]|nr:zinc ribbon domain-containing protein [Candidatus Limivivens sp.]
MAFLDRVNELAKNVAKDIMDATKNIGDVTNETIESTKLNAKIAPEKRSLDAEMKKIGEYYYQKYKDGESLEEGVLEFCAEADIHRGKIEELERMIAEIEAARIKREEAKVQEEAEKAAEVEVVEEPEKETVACPQCGAENGAHMNFCSQCGAKLEIQEEPEKEEEPEEPLKFCPNCGKELEPGMKFCGSCGTKLP